jgi:hypothetical protein
MQVNRTGAVQQDSPERGIIIGIRNVLFHIRVKVADFVKITNVLLLS